MRPAARSWVVLREHPSDYRDTFDCPSRHPPASFSTGSLKSRLERFNFRGQCCWPCRVDMVGAASRPCGCGSALGAGGSYGSGIGGSSIDGGGLSAGGGGVAGSTGPALTPGTWFVSQGDPWLHAFCAADRGRGFTSSDGLRRSCYFVAPTQQALRRIKELLIDPDCAGIAVPIGDAFSSSTIRRHRWRDSRTRRRVTR